MSISGSAYTSAHVVYGYDGAYQLTKTTRTGGEAYTNAFYYDSAGNRTKRVLDATTTTYLYDYIDRMTKAGAGPMQWDEWGSMTSYYAHTCEWDDSDRITKFDHATGTSNDSTNHYLPGSWKRYKRVQDTTAEYFIFDGDNVLASYASNGTLNASYLTPLLRQCYSAKQPAAKHEGFGGPAGLDANVSITNDTDTFSREAPASPLSASGRTRHGEACFASLSAFRWRHASTRRILTAGYDPAIQGRSEF